MMHQSSARTALEGGIECFIYQMLNGEPERIDQSRDSVLDICRDWPDALLKIIFARQECMEVRLVEFMHITDYFDTVFKQLEWTLQYSSFLAIAITGPSEDVIRDSVADAIAGINPRRRGPAHEEFCNQYNINPATEALQLELDELDSIPPDDGMEASLLKHPFMCDNKKTPAGMIDTFHERVDISQTTTNQNGRIMRRRAISAAGYTYYYCTHPHCKGSIAVSQTGFVTPVRAHTCIPVNVEVTPDDWSELVQVLAQRMREAPTRSPYGILAEMAEETYKWDRMIYTSRHSTLARMVGDSYQMVDNEPLSDCPFERLEASRDFVRYHSRGRKPLLILATDFMISSAASVSWLMIDGTFKCSPRAFKQVVTLLGEDTATGRFVPIVYMLLRNKEKKSYRYAFKILSTLVHFPSVEIVSCDYEDGLRTEVEKWISSENMNCRFFGCKFHFSQCIYRRLRNSVSVDRNSLLVVFEVFVGFAYLTRKEILECLSEMERRDHPLKSFVEYFTSYWMPRYDIWNLSEVDDYVIERATNNAIESFNATVGKSFDKHPRMERFICGMKKISMAKQRDVELGVKYGAKKKVQRPEKREILWKFNSWMSQWPSK